MKKVFFVAVVLILIFVLAAFLLNKRAPSVAVSQRFSVSTNLSSAVAYTNNSLVYSNGQGLIEYNFSNGQSSDLSSSAVGLGSIDTVSVSSGGEYVVFHDQQVQQSGSLANQLTAEGLSPDLSYWWVYSVNKQSFSVLPQNVVLAKAYGSGVYALSPGNGSEIFTAYTPSTLQKASSFSVTGSINFYPTSQGVLLQTPSNEIIYTKDGVVSQVLFKSTSIVGTEGNTVIAVTNSGGPKQLVKINLVNYKTSIISNNVQDQPAWLSSGYVLYVTMANPSANSQIYEYNVTNNTNKLWALSSSISSFGSAGPQINSLVGPNAAIISDSSSNYYLFGYNLANLPSSGL
jgi:hypothetical protein